MKISLITCVYNTEKYLRRCLESIKNQKYQDFEAIIINDGSTDNSQAIIDEYVNKDSRFRSITQENSGQANARNKGIKEAKGDYLVFVDSDDEIKNTYLLSLSEVIDNNLDFGFSKYKRVFDDKPNILEKKFQYIDGSNISITSTEKNPEVLAKVPNSPWAKIFRKQFVIDNNIHFYPNRIHDDFLFTMSVLLCNPSLMSINDESYIYHIHSGTIMTSKRNREYETFDVFDAVVDMAKSRNKFEYYFDELEYLAFHHIAVGVMYRLFCYKPLMFLKNLKNCRNYLKKYRFKNDNKYLKNVSLFEKMYLFIFFSI